jgi:hypothetical protein
VSAAKFARYVPSVKRARLLQCHLRCSGTRSTFSQICGQWRPLGHALRSLPRNNVTNMRTRQTGTRGRRLAAWTVLSLIARTLKHGVHLRSGRITELFHLFLVVIQESLRVEDLAIRDSLRSHNKRASSMQV